MKPKGRNQNETQRSCLHLDNCTENDSNKKTSCNGVMSAGSREGLRKKGIEVESEKLTYKVDQLVSGSSDEKIKLIRAQGGCPGTKRR